MRHGRPDDRSFLFLREKANIIDDWHVLGLRGTGNDTYAVADLFVPDEHAPARDIPEERRETGPGSIRSAPPCFMPSAFAASHWDWRGACWKPMPNWRAAGIAAILNSAPFERRLRDAMSAGQHSQAMPALIEMVGRHIIGCETAVKFL